MEKITQRLCKYMEYKGLNPNNITVDAGLSVGLIGKAIKNSSGLNSETIEKILHAYTDLNPIWFVLNEGEMLKPNVQDLKHNNSVTNSVTFLEETKNKKNVTLSINELDYPYKRMPQVVTVDSQGLDNIVMVPVSAHAGYLTGYGDPEFIQKLPTYRLPSLNNGTFRMFQLTGHSMYPTMHDKSYVVGEWCENWIKDIKDNKLYVVVVQSDENEGILVKRVLNRIKKYDNLYLKSDNRKEYPNLTIKPNEIKEVWEVKIYLGWDLPDPAVLYERVSDLEAEIEHVKLLLKSKN